LAGRRPKQGWIYFINPYQVSLRCSLVHIYIYELTEPGDVDCRHPSCRCKLNSSHVFRGEHPHIIWTSDQFQDEYNYIETFTVLPLTTKTRDTGLPTTYPLPPNQNNGLSEKSYVLVHQLITVDANCFKNSNGNWLERVGQVTKDDRQEIDERLKYFLAMPENPEDWLIKNASPEILVKVFDCLPSVETKKQAIEQLIDRLEE
jgi:mRNA-degrading endonuclease toxin of MazEF toxin-antitoxin module